MPEFIPTPGMPADVGEQDRRAYVFRVHDEAGLRNSFLPALSQGKPEWTSNLVGVSKNLPSTREVKSVVNGVRAIGAIRNLAYLTLLLCGLRIDGK